MTIQHYIKKEFSKMNELQKKIFSGLLHEIMTGKYRVGDTLPTELEIGKMLQVTRHNSHYAVKALENAGIVMRNKKRGTVVTRIPSKFELNSLKRFTAKKVCILNHSHEDYRHIHWNERISVPLEKELNRAGIEMETRIITDIKNTGDYMELLEDITDQGISAIMIIPAGGVSGLFLESAEMLFRYHESLFIFDRGSLECDESILNTVGINDFADGVTAVETAIRSGTVRRIIFCMHQITDCRWQKERLRGVRLGAWRMSGGAVFVENYVHGVHGEFPLNAPSPETVLIACHDEAAVTFIEAGKRRNLHPGKDYKIIGFGDDSRFSQYELTTLSPNLELIAKHLARQILDSIANREPAILHSCRVSSKLIRRKTL